MQITGKIIYVSPISGGTSQRGNQWEKQEYVIETIEQYPKRCCFSLMNEKIAASNVQLGEELTVDFDIDAREYNGRWYNSVNAWKVTRPGETYQPAAPAGGYAAGPAAPVQQSMFPPQSNYGVPI